MSSSYTFQADGVVSNGSGFAVRSDINNQLKALFSTSIGPTEPPTRYHCQLWADTSADQLKIRDKTNSNWVALRGLDGAFVVPDGNAVTPSFNFSTDTNTGIYKHAADTIGFSVGGNKQMLIGGDIVSGDGGPSVLFKTLVNPFKTNAEAGEGAQFTQRGRLNIGTFGAHSVGLNRLNTTGAYVVFAYNGNQLSGATISTNGTSVAYNTGSDYRLKENIVSLTGAKARVNQIPVYRFNFTNDSSIVVDGFIAHEAQAVVPEAVTGRRDEVDENGNPVYQGIDQAKFVPLLTAALQEAFAEIAALTARIETLEAG